jgi:hypothetical protein
MDPRVIIKTLWISVCLLSGTIAQYIVHPPGG